MSTFPVIWPASLAVVAEPVVTALSFMKVGAAGYVREVRADGSTGERLLEMGLTPGTRVRVVRRGIFGGPWVVEVRGYVLSLGGGQAQQIHVMPQG